MASPRSESTVPAAIVRLEPRLRPGARRTTPLFDAGLLDLTADRRDVLAVRVDFHRPLTDPDLPFIGCDGQRLVRLDPAALVPGQRMFLADTSDVWASM